MNATIRALADTPEDVALGRELVHEYVVATAEETAADVDFILQLVPDVDGFAGRYLHGGAFLVATVDGTVAGGVGITPGAGGTCEMNRLWVRPAYQGHGVGRSLAEASLRTSRELGFASMVLDVVPTRTRAIALYRSLGFVEIPVFHDYPFEMVAFARPLVGEIAAETPDSLAG